MLAGSCILHHTYCMTARGWPGLMAPEVYSIVFKDSRFRVLVFFSLGFWAGLHPFLSVLVLMVPVLSFPLAAADAGYFLSSCV